MGAPTGAGDITEVANPVEVGEGEPCVRKDDRTGRGVFRGDDQRGAECVPLDLAHRPCPAGSGDRAMLLAGVTGTRE